MNVPSISSWIRLITSMRTKVEKRQKESDTFVDVVFIFLMLETPYTAKKFEAIKAQIRARKPQQYSGQNILAMCEDLRDDIKKLSVMYDPQLTLDMLTNFLMADGGLEFQKQLLDKKLELEEMLPSLFHLPVVEQEKKLVEKELGWEDILLLAEKRYQLQMQPNNITWPPAKSVTDSKAPPSNFSTTGVSANLLQAAVNLLIQQANNSGSSSQSKETRSCFNCNEPGHVAKDCPKPKKKKGPGNNSKQSGSTKKNKSKNPRFIPPDDDNLKPVSHKNGDPVYEKLIKGTKFYWCGKCKKWTTTHSTPEHTGKTTDGTKAQVNNTSFDAFGLIPDPSMWIVDLAPPTFWHGPWFLLKDTLWLPLIWLFLGVVIGTLFGGIMYESLSMLSVHLPLVARSFLAFFGEKMDALAYPLMLWFTLYVAIQHGPTLLSGSPPAPDPFQYKALKKKLKKRLQKQKPPKLVPGSIRDHGLSRHYPRKNRSNGWYYKHPPTVEMRKLRAQCDEILWRVAHVDRVLRKQSGSKAQEGVGAVNKKRKFKGKPLPPPAYKTAPKVFNDSKHQVLDVPQMLSTIRGSVPRKQRMCRPVKPVPVSNGPSNMNLSKKQASRVKKMLCQIHMARVQLTSFLEEAPLSYDALVTTALKQPQVMNVQMKKEDTFSVIWDSGASQSISFDKNDFVGPIKTVPLGSKLSGMAKGLNIAGIGHVVWCVQDEYGTIRHLKIPALYVPNAKQRLLSTTVLRNLTGENMTIETDGIMLHGKAGHTNRGPVKAKNNPLNNLPTTICFRCEPLEEAALNLAESVNTVHKSNANLSEPEKELLRQHQRLGHVNFRVIQFLMKMGVLAFSQSQKKLHTAASKIQHPPKCAACQFGKQRSRPVPGKKTTTVQDRAGVISADQVLPGQRVSVDHFVCSTRGRLLSGYGVKKNHSTKDDPKLYCGGCLFIDEATGHVVVEFQKHLNTHETLAALESFEAKARDSGVIPQSYTTDNGSCFTSRGFFAHLSKFAQTVRHSGAGSHHQNGKAERAIQTIMGIARTMMLHAAIHWPETADPTLWPMAVTHAVWLWNHLPNPETGLSPHDLWTKTRYPLRDLQNVHVWGCPMYVLEKKLADGRKIGKWQARSERMMHMGFSPKHASTVPLGLNLDTGSITPNWNVVFDDWFATVGSTVEELPDFNSPEWSELFGDATHCQPFDDEDDDAAAAEAHAPSPQVTAKITRTADLMDQHVYPQTPPLSQQRELPRPESQREHPAPSRQDFHFPQKKESITTALVDTRTSTSDSTPSSSVTTPPPPPTAPENSDQREKHGNEIQNPQSQTFQQESSSTS